MGLNGTVLDATTVWLFRERLVRATAIGKLFALFEAALTYRGYLAMGGKIIDAIVTPAPEQRITEAEKAAKPVDLAIPMFDYEKHKSIDRAHGLIRSWDASASPGPRA